MRGGNATHAGGVAIEDLNSADRHVVAVLGMPCEPQPHRDVWPRILEIVRADRQSRKIRMAICQNHVLARLTVHDPRLNRTLEPPHELFMNVRFSCVKRRKRTPKRTFMKSSCG